MYYASVPGLSLALILTSGGGHLKPLAVSLIGHGSAFHVIAAEGSPVHDSTTTRGSPCACDTARAEELPEGDTPLGIVLRISRAYEARQPAPFAEGLTQDFQFSFAEPELRAQYPRGFTRDDEIASATHLFYGFVDRSGVHRPAARCIEVRLDSLRVVTDPEHSDSSEAYQLVIVPRTSLHIVLESGECLDVPPRWHVFHCVRGAAALLGPDQPRGEDDWYVRRWDEFEDGDDFRQRATAFAPKASIANMGHVELAVRAEPNPAVREVAVMLSLPAASTAALDLLDVAGRRVSHEDLGSLGPGLHRVSLRARPPVPGVYWLRLSQGRELAVSRVVIAK